MHQCPAGKWQLGDARSPDGGKEETIQAKALVNAAGPWVARFWAASWRRNNPDKIRMVKGSHIVVDQAL